MKKKILKISTAFALLLFVTGCQDGLENLQTPMEVNSSLVYRVPATPHEKQLVSNFEKVAEVLKVLYKDRSNLNVVYAAIYAKTYTDESILLKDLIYPERSRLQSNKRFNALSQKWGVQLDAFASGFWTEASKRNDPAFKSFLEGVAATSSAQAATLRVAEMDPSETSIYMPYFENVEELIDDSGGGYFEPITSVVAATADADQGIGSQPYYVDGALQFYVDVLIDDEYAYNNPTQIIGINGIEPYDAGHPESMGTAFPPEGPIDLPNLPREVKQVYVGDVRVNGRQYDALISFTGNGGGSEIRFTRADGFLQVNDGQVQANVFIIGDRTISRKSIRKKRWVDYSAEWDGDWEVNNLQQNLAIYEEDNRNSSTFSAQVTTTLTWPPAGGQPGVTVAAPIGFTINYKSDDYIIRQSNYNRDVFFPLNRINLEGEMYNGWPVRDKTGNVSFTLNDRTLY